MSAIDLVILGHLMGGPKSAYEIKKDLVSQNITNWVKISIPAIYQNVIRLYKKGMLGAQTKKEGAMPEKTVYRINEKGLEYFSGLMQKYSEDISGIYFNFSAFVVNLDKVERDAAIGMIAGLKKQFELTKDILDKQMINKSFLPYHAFSIIELYDELFKLFYEWSGKLLRRYSEDT